MPYNNKQVEINKTTNLLSIINKDKPINLSQNNALVPYASNANTATKELMELENLQNALNSLQRLENHFKDFMSMPFSVIVDSKGNAMPLTIEALKNFVLQNLYREWQNIRKELPLPTLQLDFKPLNNQIKALPYKVNSEIKTQIKDINAKTNDFLDSIKELEAKKNEIKLLAYDKPTENKSEVDRFSNVVDSKPLQELQSLRNNLSTILAPILNKDITNISSGITAQVSKTSIKKMGSDKAINKSIE